MDTASQHGAAGDEDGGNIDTGGSHQQAGHVFITVGDHDHAVEAVGTEHGLGGVSDQVTGDEGVLHALMAHGDAVADGNGGEDDGGAAGHGDAQLNGVNDLIQIDVAGNDLVIGADNGDEGALLFFLGQAKGVVKAAVGRILCAADDGVFDHSGFQLSIGNGRRGGSVTLPLRNI